MYRFLMFFLLFLFWARPQVQGNGGSAYLILYATDGGKTGHVGIALDKQRIRITDCSTCEGGVRYDTVKTGELVFFDLWPATETWSYNYFFGSVPARYNRLPNNSTAPPITVLSLLRKGLPHAMKGPCHGLLKIPISPTQNAELTRFLQDQIDAGRPFNLYDFNCSDYVALALRQILPVLPDADEKVLAHQATTPNRLWQAVAGLPQAIILKDPGEKVNGRFNSQRIFTSLHP